MREALNILNDSPISTKHLVPTVLLPIFSIVALPEVRVSIILEDSLSKISRFMFGPNGDRAREIFKPTLEVLLKESQADKGWFGRQANANYLESFLGAFRQVTKSNQDAIVTPDLVQMAEQFRAFFEADNEQVIGRSASGLRARGHYETISQHFSLGNALQEAKDTSNQKEVKHKADFKLREDGPGALSPDGPRHNNDHANISQIQVMPTQAEIVSARKEYLPRNDLLRLHFSGAQGLIDRQFRLLREDTVGQLRDAVKVEIDRQRAQQQGLHVSKENQQTARTLTYMHGGINDLAPHDFHGLQFEFAFAQPLNLWKMTEQQRKGWWQRSKRLSPGALVCLLDVQGTALFAVVIIREKANKHKQFPNAVDQVDEKLYADPQWAYVCLSLIDVNHENTHTLFERLDRPPGSEIMIEFPGILLASFAPTLTALKSMAMNPVLPFSEILAPLSESQGEPLHIPPPAYATKPGFAFDLKPVLDGETLSLSMHTPFDASSFHVHTAFDEGQANAVIDALSRRVALIQGPPGTGKSYTGVALIKILLHNQTAGQLGPILTVCYTNHALDQLLEHLIDAGVEQVVRIGSRSKSDQLQEINLNKLRMKMEETRAEKKQFWDIREQQRKATKRLSQVIKIKLDIHEAETLRMYLLDAYPAQSNELFAEEDEEGFRVVGDMPDKRVRTWLQPRAADLVHLQHQTRSLATLNHASLWQMNLEERWALYQDWIATMKTANHQEIEDTAATYIETKAKLDNIRRELDLRILMQANVIGVTTSGLARIVDLLGRLSSKVLICEEAGEVLEAHTLTALLPSIEHTILIGDHLQLRPSIQDYSLQHDNPRGKVFSLDVSLFERLVDPQNTSIEKVPHSTLLTQRRMHPSISRLIQKTLYDDLQNSPSVLDYSEVVGMQHRLFWLDHQNYEASHNHDEHVTTSHSNDWEINMTTALVSHLVKQGVYASTDIAVLTPYLGNLVKLRHKLSGAFQVVLDERDMVSLQAEGLDPDGSEDGKTNGAAQVTRKTSLLNALRVATIDNFQGEEAKVVVISLVRSNPECQVGFLKTSNRINVLLSRAKHGMYIIGNGSTARTVPMWQRVIGLLEQQGLIGTTLSLTCPRHNTVFTVAEPDDFSRVAPEGGCRLPCPDRLSCGHKCHFACHSKLMHEAVVCLEECPRPLPGCHHSCPRPCGESCPKRCNVAIAQVKLPCGHSPQLSCWEAQDPDKARCPVKVSKIMPGCGHTITVKCADSNNKELRCSAQCSIVLPCGHACKSVCANCRDFDLESHTCKREKHPDCRETCKRPYTTCQHACQKACHGNEPCELCQSPCQSACRHSKCRKKCSEPCAPCAEATCDSHCLEHHRTCSMPCGAPCDWVPCSTRCKQSLVCGHQCPSVCCETCPDVTFCQTCSTEDVRSQRVDLILSELYRNIDLDEMPVICLPCGHIFTLESLDGQMDMGKHFDIDENGHPVGIRTSSQPFSMDEIKRCPDCRAPLGTIRRYGRIVRRAMLDESTKKFIAWSKQREEQLYGRLQALEKADGAAPRNPPPAFAFAFRLANSRDNQIATLRSSRTRLLQSLIEGSIRLRQDIKEYAQLVRVEEQPFRKVHDMVLHKAKQNRASARFEWDDSVLQTKTFVQAFALLLRSDLAILAKILTAYRNRNPGQAVMGTLEMDLTKNREDCVALMRIAKEAMLPKEVVEGHVLWARFAAIECSVGKSAS